MNGLSKKDEQEISDACEVSKERESGEIVNGIFKALKLIFPAWRHAIKTDQELAQIKAMWLRTLIDEKITTQEQISRGLKGARNCYSAFFPSIGQFIEWTKKTKPRVNEDMYKEFQYALPAKTRAEYKKIGNKRLDELRKNLEN